MKYEVQSTKYEVQKGSEAAGFNFDTRGPSSLVLRTSYFVRAFQTEPKSKTGKFWRSPRFSSRGSRERQAGFALTHHRAFVSIAAPVSPT